jgi:hypothetical protein
MRWIRIVAIILGASWFFPVSCTSGVIVGTQLVAKLDEREVLKGDEVHSLFKIVKEPGENGKSFYAVNLSELSDVRDIASFRMSKPRGSIDSGNADISYKVIKEMGSGQLIEVVETYHDGDNTIWSRYRATETSVIPVSSRMFYFGYLFGAFPYGLGFALIIYLIGRFLRRKVNIT